MISESTYSEASPDEENHPADLDDRPSGQPGLPEVEEKRQGKQLLLHGIEPATGQVKVVFSQVALRQIEGHSASDLRRELGGVLLGHTTQSVSSTRVLVSAAIPVRSDDHGPVHFTFNADAWSQLHLDRAERYPKLDVVGWYHTHPDLGVFYSADDLVVHSAAFVLPWQVGMVLDPVRGEICLVGWCEKETNSQARELAGLPGYYEQMDQQNSSVVSWRFIRASIWRQGGYLPTGNLPSGKGLAEFQNSDVYGPNSDWPSLPVISPWWGVALGGLSLLISLLLLLDRLLGSF
jgi:proteasome lid subunit RPN8/RPN11